MTRVTEASVRSMLRADKASRQDRGDELLLAVENESRQDSHIVKSTKRLAKVRRFVEE